MYYIYLIYSPSSDKYYVGSTDDPLRRLEQHNNSPFNTFTSKHRPWEWVALFECSESRGGAVRIEKFIKRQKNKRIYQQLMEVRDLQGPFFVLGF